MWRDFKKKLQTDRRQTDRRNDCLTPLRACAHGVIMGGFKSNVPIPSKKQSILKFIIIVQKALPS